MKPLPRDHPFGSKVTASIESTRHHEEWDEFLAMTAGGDLVQTAAWGRVKRSAGMEICRMVARDHGVILGGVQLIVRSFGPLGSVAYAPFGPVIAPQAGDDVVRLLVAELLRQIRCDRIRALFVQPPEGGERIATALRSNGFRPTAVSVAPSATVRIDVQLGPELLVEQMSKHARREFRQSQRDPLTVRRGTRSDLASFYELYCSTAARQGFQPLSFRYVESMLDELQPLGMVEIFLADVDGTDVAANMVTTFAGVVTGRLLGFDPDRLERRLRPNEALIWAIISWAGENGAKALDVGGIDRAEALEVTTGAGHHKTRLGGTTILHPSPLELIPNRALRSTFGVIQSNQLLRRVENRLRTDAPIPTDA